MTFRVLRSETSLSLKRVGTPPRQPPPKRVGKGASAGESAPCVETLVKEEESALPASPSPYPSTLPRTRKKSVKQENFKKEGIKPEETQQECIKQEAIKQEEEFLPQGLPESQWMPTLATTPPKARLTGTQDSTSSLLKGIKVEGGYTHSPTREVTPKKRGGISKKLEDPSWGPPPHWEELYNHVARMRAKIVAPVDTMGCERLPERVAGRTTPRSFRYQLLISLMMSSQTKDEVNYQAMVSLHEGLIARGHPEGLTLEAILVTEERDLDSMICKVGFHNRKALYIKQASALLRDKFGGDVPKTIEEVVSLPGVGPKMGFLLLQRAWDVVTGIGVDVHVFRLANMWRWVPKVARPTPEHARAELEKWLPREKWVELNPLLVGFGQTVCLPKAPRCDLCTVAPTGLCPGVKKKAMTTVNEGRANRGDISALEW